MRVDTPAKRLLLTTSVLAGLVFGLQLLLDEKIRTSPLMEKVLSESWEYADSAFAVQHKMSEVPSLFWPAIPNPRSTAFAIDKSCLNKLASPAPDSDTWTLLDPLGTQRSRRYCSGSQSPVFLFGSKDNVVNVRWEPPCWVGMVAGQAQDSCTENGEKVRWRIDPLMSGGPRAPVQQPDKRAESLLCALGYKPEIDLKKAASCIREREIVYVSVLIGYRSPWLDVALQDNLRRLWLGIAGIAGLLIIVAWRWVIEIPVRWIQTGR